MTYSAVRRRAKVLSQGQKLALAPFILVAFILGLAQLGTNYLALALAPATALLSLAFAALTVGYLSRYRGNAPRTLRSSDATFFFRKGLFGKALLVWLWQTLILTGLALVGFIGLMLVKDAQTALRYNYFMDATTAYFNLIIGLLLMGAGTVLTFFFSMRYSMTFLVLYDKVKADTYTSAWDCLKTSNQLMTGRSWQLFVLGLTFLPWYLLVFLTLGLASFYVTPYYQAAIVVFYEDSRSDKDKPDKAVKHSKKLKDFSPAKVLGPAATQLKRVNFSIIRQGLRRTWQFIRKHTDSSVRKRARQLRKNKVRAFEPIIIAGLLLGLVQIFLQFYPPETSTYEKGIPASAFFTFIIAFAALLLNFAILSVSTSLLDAYRGDRSTPLESKDWARLFGEKYVHRYIIVYLLKALVLGFFTLLFASGIALYFLTILWIRSEAISSLTTYYLCLLAAAFLLVFALIFYIRFSLHYSMSGYVLYDQIKNGDYKEWRPWLTLTASRRLMTGHKWAFVRLALSFIGWYLLVLATFGFAAVYVLPYYQTAIVIFYDDLCKGAQTA